MATEITRIRFKRSEKVGQVPTEYQLGVGEMAFNMTDKAIFTKNSAGKIVQFTGAGADILAKTVTATSDVKSSTGVYAGSAKLGTDGNITGGSKFGGNLDTYLTGIKNSVTQTSAAKVSKVGDTMTGKLGIKAETSENNIPIFETVSSKTAAPIRLNRPTSDENISIAFQGQTILRYLGLSRNGELHWGENINQSGNAKVYTTDHKPTKGDVGLSNVTNDVQVKKAGDTMTGNLTVPKVLVSTAQGNETNSLTRKDYVDAQVKSAKDKAKTDVDLKVSKAGDEMTGRLNIFKDDGGDATPLLHVRSTTAHTPLLIERRAKGNASIGFRLADGSTNLLGVDENLDIRYGKQPAQLNNALILTSDNLDKAYNKGSTSYISPLYQAMYGGSAPAPTDGSTPDTDNYLEGVRMYDISAGNNAGYPGSLGVILSAKINVNRTIQFFGSSDDNLDKRGLWYRSIRKTSSTPDRWDRLAFSSMRNDFTALQVFRNGINVDTGIRANGNIGLGVNANTSTDPNISFAAGSSIREGTGEGLGALVISAGTVSGSLQKISLRPRGTGITTDGVDILNDASIEVKSSNSTAYFQINGARFKSGPTGTGTDSNSVYIEANNGNVVLRSRQSTNTNSIMLGTDGNFIQTAAQSSNNGALTRKDYVLSQVGTRLPLAGGTMTGNIIMGGSTQIANSTKPTAGAHLTNKDYVDQELAKAVKDQVKSTDTNDMGTY
ncbi:hypothetical protein NFF31_001552 [Klebsiella aerogenes]|nr:hypothetical protein [Klebsiella aerogenes]